MSISARLFVEDQEYNILEFDLKFNQEVDFMGNPISNFKGGYWDIKLETIKSPLLLQWMLDSSSMKKVKIVIPSRFGTSKSRNIELLDTYCISNNKAFNSTNTEPLITSITLSPASMIENGEVVFSKSWRVTDPTPKAPTPVKDTDTEKKLIISFDANKTDIKEGKFGFDKIPDNYKKILKTNTVLFEKEYNPIQVYGEQYFPIWVSMRKDQKITLELDILKHKNKKLYQTIEFESHPDFTFSPTNLKDAKEITITCNNTNPNTLQLKVLGDNDPVGAINFFYPDPKTIDLRWVVINFNKGDKEKISKDFSIDTLKKYFKTAFNPALIDIKIVNTNHELLDYTLPSSNKLEQAFIDQIKNTLETGKNDSVKQDEKSKIQLISGLNSLHQARMNRLQSQEVFLYLSKIKSSSIKEADGNETILSNNGITVSRICLMFLGNESQNMKPSVEIPHEVMHALGLQHTFKEGEKHILKQSTTSNFMDYQNNKIDTFVWQWKSLH